MGFLDSVKNALKGAVAAPPRTTVPDSAPDPVTDRSSAREPESQEAEKPAPELTTYTIRTGDTLADIGARHGVARDELARLNDIAEPDLIFPGQELRIPAS